MQLSHRYNSKTPAILTNTQQTTAYRSKRNRCGFSIRQTALAKKNSSDIISPKKCDIQYIQPSSAFALPSASRSDRALRQIKLKLTHFLSPQYTQQFDYQQNNTSFDRQPSKKQQNYKISLFRTIRKRKIQIEMMRTSYQGCAQDISKDFCVKEACIRPRQSIKQPHSVGRVGVKRDFLKYYGENKCFQQAVQFRKKNNPLDFKNMPVSILYKQSTHDRLNSIKDCSLQYSLQQLDFPEMEPWKRQSKEQLDQNEFILSQHLK